MISPAIFAAVADELQAAADAYRVAVDDPDAHAEELADARLHAATLAAVALLTDNPHEPAQPVDGTYRPGDPVLWISTGPNAVGAPLLIQPGTVRDEAYPCQPPTLPGARLYVVDIHADYAPSCEHTIRAADLIRSPNPAAPATARAS